MYASAEVSDIYETCSRKTLRLLFSLVGGWGGGYFFFLQRRTFFYLTTCTVLSYCLESEIYATIIMIIGRARCQPTFGHCKIGFFFTFFIELKNHHHFRTCIRIIFTRGTLSAGIKLKNFNSSLRGRYKKEPRRRCAYKKKLK